MREQSQSKVVTSCFVLGLLAIAMVACRGCDPRPDDQSNRNNNQSSPAPTVTSPITEARLRRHYSEVEKTDLNQQWEFLKDNSWRDVSGRTLIRTDENGEGWLKLQDCMLVYVFQDTRMVTSKCSKAEASSGHENCLIEGTAVYNDPCGVQALKLIQTPTAEITPHGTWFSVTYLADQQLTLVMVFDGTVSVRPVTDMTTHSLGEAKEIGTGQLWFTVPDERLDQGGGGQRGQTNGDPRTVKSISEYQSVITALAGRWTTRISERAQQDKINIPALEGAVPSPTTSDDGEPPNEDAQAQPNCDCGNVEVAYRERCLAIEQNLISQFKEAKRVVGRCVPPAAGPNARPR